MRRNKEIFEDAKNPKIVDNDDGNKNDGDDDKNDDDDDVDVDEIFQQKNNSAFVCRDSRGSTWAEIAALP